ncbi:MAG: thiosulfate oxidation carrier complex protein SoxZ [Gammaproteobacteria bacterium]|nr:thiosulfate oxidation carrier complex protein SoxZ [Gammaproteobacteria bacterium]
MARSQRRTFLKGTAASVLFAVAGWLKPRDSVAAEWPKDAFSAATLDEVLHSLYGSAQPVASREIQIKAPYQVSDGARVAVTVSTTLTNVESISIIAAKNPQPLVAHMSFRRTLPYFSINIKLAASTPLFCIVKAGNRLYSATQLIKVAATSTGTGYSQVAEPQVPRRDVKMRVRRVNKDTEIVSLIEHPMETGLHMDAKTAEKIPAHFIQKVIFTLNDREALVADIGSTVARDPLFKIRFKKTKAGDRIKLSWSDNKGETGANVIVVPAEPKHNRVVQSTNGQQR